MDTEAKRACAVELITGLGTNGVAHDLVTADLTWWVQGRGSKTLDEINDTLRQFGALKEGPGYHQVIGSTVEGDRVAVETECFIPFKGGATYNNTYHFLIEFSGDRIRSVKEYYNSAYTRDFLAALEASGGASA